jgi:xanthine dehydrogenase YagS FAD-binding subunit
LDGKVIITGPTGERRVAVTDFYAPLGNAVKTDEMVREIEIPALAGRTKQGFLKFTLRKPVDFAIVSVAAILTMEKDICSGARIALGAVAPAPFRARAAEELLVGRHINETVAEEAARLAIKGARPLSGNAYKVEIVKSLVKRAIMS